MRWKQGAIWTMEMAYWYYHGGEREEAIIMMMKVCKKFIPDTEERNGRR